jgi:hypothetical protein
VGKVVAQVSPTTPVVWTLVANTVVSAPAGKKERLPFGGLSKLRLSVHLGSCESLLAVPLAMVLSLIFSV